MTNIRARVKFTRPPKAVKGTQSIEEDVNVTDSPQNEVSLTPDESSNLVLGVHARSSFHFAHFAVILDEQITNLSPSI